MPRASHPPITRKPAQAVEPPAYVTLTVAADRLSLCDRTIRRAIAAGELTGYKFGKALRVRLADLDRWAETKAAPNARTLSKVR